MSDSPLPLRLARDAPERDYAPKSGSNSALGAAFNTNGRSNADFKHGDVVKYRDQSGFHTAQVAGEARTPDTFDILLAERQVLISSVAPKAGEQLRVGGRVAYTKNGSVDQAIVEKISYELDPPAITIRIIRRDVERSRLMKSTL